ncbi:putative N-acyltransferase [Bradyrhizobium liaoningense]
MGPGPASHRCALRCVRGTRPVFLHPLKSLLQCTILGAMASSDITLEAVPSIGEVSPEDWDACANPGKALNEKACKGHGLGTSSALPGDSLSLSSPAYNPFVSHAFLSAAEKSGSATIRTGWGPRHLVAKLDGRVVGVVPCYLKSHSQGEYVFDRGWADAYERAGGRYYPKLQVSVPFTPGHGTAVAGPRRRRPRADH